MSKIINCGIARPDGETIVGNVEIPVNDRLKLEKELSETLLQPNGYKCPCGAKKVLRTGALFSRRESIFHPLEIYIGYALEHDEHCQLEKNVYSKLFKVEENRLENLEEKSLDSLKSDPIVKGEIMFFKYGYVEKSMSNEDFEYFKQALNQSLNPKSVKQCLII
jgi:hypothetical protein